MPIEEWDDQRLLHDFVENGAQDSFAELVHRHISWISGTALRALGGDRHLAEDVTQQVFTDFAQKSASLRNHPSMIGWLYQSTRRAAAQTVRTEQRRKMREQLGQLINETAPPSLTAGENLRPLIDEALEALSQRNRELILLRYLRHQTFAKIGADLSLSADAARMRTERALEKMRAFMARRGIASTSSALATTLADQILIAAPGGLSTTIIASVFSQAGVAGGIAGSTTASTPLLSVKLLLSSAAALTGAAVLYIAVINPKSLSLETEKQAGDSILSVNIPTPETPMPATSTPTLPTLQGPLSDDKNSRAVSDTSTLASPRLARLARLVGLSEAQKSAATTIFAREIETLKAFEPGETRITQGMQVRQRTRREIGELLTPAQKKIYEASPQRLGGASSYDMTSEVARIDESVTLSDEQILRAAAIYQQRARALQDLTPEQREGSEGRAIRQTATKHVHALLTPEQQISLASSPRNSQRALDRQSLIPKLRSNSALIQRNGAIKEVSVVNESVTVTSRNKQSQRELGTHHYQVQGTSQTEVITVRWEKDSPTSLPLVTKIETQQGVAIPQ